MASESYLEKPKVTGGWSKKYSFSMLDALGASRLSALTVELLHNDVVMDTRPYDVTLVPVLSI